MTVAQQERSAEQGERAGGQDPATRAFITAGIVFAVLVVAFWFAWPVGVVLGLGVGVAATVRLGQRMHATAQTVPVAAGLADADDELWQEFRRLRVRLGDDWAAFSAAAIVVTRAQSASSALLRRELGVPTARAQHVIQLLEREGFIGPARGTQPRLVRVDCAQSELLQELLHG